MSFKITKNDKVWQGIKKNLNQANNQQLSVGYFPESVYGPENDNQPVAQIARDNNEGTYKNPPRPFFTIGFMSPVFAGKYNKEIGAIINRIAEGKSTFSEEFKILGPVLVEGLKQSIIRWDSPPNSPRTIAEKGKNDPLRDTDTMLNSTAFKIENKGVGE